MPTLFDYSGFRLTQNYYEYTIYLQISQASEANKKHPLGVLVGCFKLWKKLILCHLCQRSQENE